MDDNSNNNLPIPQTVEYEFKHIYPVFSQISNLSKYSDLIVTPTIDIKIQLKPKAVANNLLHPNCETRYVIIRPNSSNTITIGELPSGLLVIAVQKVPIIRESILE